MWFTIVFLNVLMILVYLLIGFLLVKLKKIKSEHAKSFSGVLVYICQPCIIINSIIHIKYSINTTKDFAMFFFITLCLQLILCLILYLLLKKKLYNSKYRVLIITTISGNVTFMGFPIISALFPNNPIVPIYSTMFLVSMNLIVFTIGIYLITNNKKYMSLKNVLTNVTSLSIYVAIIIYILQIKIPPLILNSIEIFSKMTTPLCMIILGMRLASMNIKETFTNKFAYIASLCKLIIFPLFAYVIVSKIMLNEVSKTSLIVLCSTPSAAIVLSISEMYECEQKLIANIILISTILSIITMPLLMLIL